MVLIVVELEWYIGKPIVQYPCYRDLVTEDGC